MLEDTCCILTSEAEQFLYCSEIEGRMGEIKKTTHLLVMYL